MKKIEMPVVRSGLVCLWEFSSGYMYRNLKPIFAIYIKEGIEGERQKRAGKKCSLAPRYQHASPVQKALLLDASVASAGYRGICPPGARL
jgi:hypothetical protein